MQVEQTRKEGKRAGQHTGFKADWNLSHCIYIYPPKPNELYRPPSSLVFTVFMAFTCMTEAASFIAFVISNAYTIIYWTYIY